MARRTRAWNSASLFCRTTADGVAYRAFRDSFPAGRVTKDWVGGGEPSGERATGPCPVSPEARTSTP